MRARSIVATFAMMVFVARAQALAQYQSPSPFPPSTSVPSLRAQAINRSVVERFHLGLDAIMHGDWQRAQVEFATIVSLAPPEPQGSTALYDLALAQAHLGNNGGAAASLRDALARDPGFLAAMANLIAIYLRDGRVKDARAVADRFVAIAPDSARALYTRGLIALQSNDLATARDDFSKLLRNDPQYAVAHYNLGIASARLGRYSDAEREFSAAIAIAPAYARARFALGTILLRDGNRTAARAAFDRAAADASDDIALRSLAIEMRDAITASP